jgi:hypothetical protein
MIPKEVLNDIVARAKENWPDNKEMQKFCISEETAGYERLQLIDFGDISNLKDEFIKSAMDVYDSWDDACSLVESELDAYYALQEFSVGGVEKSTIEEWKKEAKEAHDNYYTDQLEFLENKARKHASILATREQIDPIKNLLIELEKIVGSECYNGNIQNYGSWGELESVGRSFRYPVKFYTSSGESKKWTVSSDIPSEELITGYYAFGANELSIYRALFKVVSHLKEKYGLKV